MPVPQKVVDLIATFERNADHHTAAPYKEAMLRQQFVEPSFAVRSAIAADAIGTPNQ
jgi:hypothetical protein